MFALHLTSACLLSVASLGGGLADFWRTNAGKELRRLPVSVLPQNVFSCLGDQDFTAEGAALDRERIRAFTDRSVYNCVTWTLRCKPELGESETLARIRQAAEACHEGGLQFFPDSDVRLAREEFFRRWPNDLQGYLLLGLATPTNGIARFRIVPDRFGGHMAACARRDFEPVRAELVRLWAARFDKGRIVARRPLDPAKARIDSDGRTQLSGSVAGLKQGETLVALAEFGLFSADVFSEHLMPFVHELMARHKELGADAAMHDEWGFPPSRKQMLEFRAFWTSPNHRLAYARKTGGRDQRDDALLMAFDVTGAERERYEAIRAYNRLTFERNAEIEIDFYNENKRLFGPDAYVTKHATWWAHICTGEIFHGGFDWWAAKRDWAQADEAFDLAFLGGMTKKSSGACWLDEILEPDARDYVRAAWRFAVAGGRVVYHPYDGPGLKGLSRRERALRCHTDLLSPSAVRAQARIALLNLVSTAQFESPVALVFGHDRIMNWADPAFRKWSEAAVHELGRNGYYVDAYPSSELRFGTFRVNEDGRLSVGRQAYDAVWLVHLDTEDVASWRNVAGGLRGTRVFAADCPSVEGAVRTDPDDSAPILSHLRSIGSIRQTPLANDGLHKGAGSRLPASEGTLRLQDGTMAVLKGCLPNPAGDPIAGVLELPGGSVSYEACGVFAARLGADGNCEAVAAGGLRRIVAPGLTLALDRPTDLALVRLDDGWHGLWQTDDANEPLPDALARLSSHWTRLLLPSAGRGKGVLLLTFDDSNYDRWVQYIPMFEQYGAHVSFFPNGRMDDHALEQLGKLRDAGHTVGIHTVHHRDVDSEFNPERAESYFATEVKPQLEDCMKIGHAVRAFAYPNNLHTPEFDRYLSEKAGIIHFRAGHVVRYDPQGRFPKKDLVNTDEVFFPVSNLSQKRVLEGIGIGEAYRTDIEEILACIRRAADRNEVLVTFSHDIRPDAKGVHMKAEWLERILKTAREKGMAVIGFDEI